MTKTGSAELQQVMAAASGGIAEEKAYVSDLWFVTDGILETKESCPMRCMMPTPTASV